MYIQYSIIGTSVKNKVLFCLSLYTAIWYCSLAHSNTLIVGKSCEPYYFYLYSRPLQCIPFPATTSVQSPLSLTHLLQTPSDCLLASTPVSLHSLLHRAIEEVFYKILEIRSYLLGAEWCPPRFIC